MRYVVILSLDVPQGVKVSGCEGWTAAVPRCMKLTECDNKQSEYQYLEGAWAKGGKHRKWYGEVSQKQFDRLVEVFGLVADSCETMGSMTYEGILPAISFNGEYEYPLAIISAYVTPMPECVRKSDNAWRSNESHNNMWERVKGVLMRKYGSYSARKRYSK
jgi:hypothetical protein